MEILEILHILEDIGYKNHALPKMLHVCINNNSNKKHRQACSVYDNKFLGMDQYKVIVFALN